MKIEYPPIDYKSRIDKVTKKINELGLDAFIGMRQGTVHWLVGAFMPWRGAVVVTAKGDAFLLYWAMDSERIRQEGWGMTIVEWGGKEPGFVQSLAKQLKMRNLNDARLGLEIDLGGTGQIAPGMLLASEYLDLKSNMDKSEILNAGPDIDELMLIKDEPEIERLKAACKAASAGFAAGFDVINEGVTENHIAGAIELATRMKGSMWSWAVTGGTEVGSGPRTAFFRGVTQQASERRVQRNEFLILDLHPMVDLYMADLGLPVFYGSANTEQEKLITGWEEVVNYLLSNIKPDIPASTVANGALKVFESHGLEKYGLPMFGHGLGTCARQHPLINPASKDIFKPGMVAALGTHLYKPGTGGLRLEYPILITDSGCEPLCSKDAKVYRKKD